ncbi:ATP-binding protein [Azohydromonas aeria]|uniref:ATP-binding protein n=1 Tax=Azohydromonas aeria TaxID=2590212 RepID=UPI0012FCB039|nr:ATP-binding protein [Azohydromonas aeria]
MSARPARAPVLDGDRFGRAFPFHLWVDSSLCLRSVGSALAKARPDLLAGDALGKHFEVLRPRSAAGVDDWRRHGSALCTLRAHAGGLTLRGNAEVLDNGSVLLLVSPVLGSLEQMREHGLSFGDFAKHDAAGELLLAARATRLSAVDSERLAQRLQLRTQQLDSILELSRNGVLSFDDAGRLLHVNAAALALLGLAREDTPQMTLERFDAHLDALLEPPQRGQAWLRRASAAAELPRLTLGRPRHTVIELGCRDGGRGGRNFYLRDVTRETELDRMKSEFLATAAHELRTPLASVFGFAELLLHRSTFGEREREMLRTIHRQGALLIDIVDELLDLARIEARGAKEIERERCRVDDVVQPVVGLFAEREGPHRLKAHPAHGAAELFVDLPKSRRALTNVLSNAYKYSPQGGEVEVDTLAGEVRGRPCIGLRVCDQGLGMSPDQLAQVFDRFYRADRSGSIPGSGLGMSLVKDIVELQDGRVDVASELGQGTCVTLWLPCAA